MQQKTEEEELNKESPPNLKEEAENYQLDSGANLTNQDQLNNLKNANTSPQNEQEDEDYLENSTKKRMLNTLSIPIKCSN